MMTESGCTLYRHNGIGFDRYYIKECHWQECKASNVIKSGNQNADSITVYIPAKALVLTPDKNLTPSKTLFIDFGKSPQNASKDIIVKGECNFTFDNCLEKTVSESLKNLNQTYNTYTVMSIDTLLYGSIDLQHIKISAR